MEGEEESEKDEAGDAGYGDSLLLGELDKGRVLTRPFSAIFTGRHCPA